MFASGPGIFGLGNKVYRDDAVFAWYDPKKSDIWDLEDPDHVNGGSNHFGSPFNFPEEFVTVYRLHALVPDLIEYREWDSDPNLIRNKIPVVDTFRGKATRAMEERGLANWALSMGRQRLGLLTLQNHPQFLQNLTLPRLRTATNKMDIAALDLIRDRERGVPRFNEFRRRLFSDRFFTSSFRPEFYSHLGVQWVNDNGPDGKVLEKGKPNGHQEEVSPLKRVLLRATPELAGELEHVVNAFDPWARDRGKYYSLEWKPRKGAEGDEAFKPPYSQPLRLKYQ